MNDEKQVSIWPTMISGLIILGFMLILSLWAWTQIPEGTKIPVHFNASGEVDRYGSKFEGLLLLPIVMIVLLIIFYFIPKLEPRRINLLQSINAFKLIIHSIWLFLAGVHVFLVMVALGYELNPSLIIPALLGFLFIMIGNSLGKLRSNFFVGIRTPWTLSSELSWDKTHHLGGWLFVIFGILIELATVMSQGKYVFMTILIGGILLVVTNITYSYIVWRNDPNKKERPE